MISSANKAAAVNKRFAHGGAARTPAPKRGVRVNASAQDEEQPHVQRRALLSSLSLALPLLKATPSLAAYGEAANVFGGTPANSTGFIEYQGDGYSLNVPSKWNPSKERIFPGTDMRYIDNFDDVNNLEVIVQKSSGDVTSKSPTEFLSSISYLFGETAMNKDFESKSEGGFGANKAAAISVLAADTKKDSNGKSYYMIELLSRTADGNEGGRHQLISAAVSKGNLYVFRAQAGDKRWIGVGKGVRAEVLGAWQSFTVA